MATVALANEHWANPGLEEVQFFGREFLCDDRVGSEEQTQYRGENSHRQIGANWKDSG
ncbi:hypothetical protein GCM10023156_07950 [Novipirellula rosea]|uniref:Uncharacterized protein n=1 Tax=Novipirellula rosea TaxID=1031540 RepID=A0ABP8MBJ4_9BACT